MEKVDYESLYDNYYRNTPDSYDYEPSFKEYTRALRYQNISNYDPSQKYYSSDWIRFESMLERKRLKIMKSRGRMMGWFLGDSNVQDDINYTFHEYLRKRQEIYDNQKRINEKLRRDKEEAKRLEEERIEREKQAEIDRQKEIEREKNAKIQRKKQEEIQRQKQAELDAKRAREENERRAKEREEKRKRMIARQKQDEEDARREREQEEEQMRKYEEAKRAQLAEKKRKKQQQREFEKEAALERERERFEKQQRIEKIKKYKIKEFIEKYPNLFSIYKNYKINEDASKDLELFFADIKEKN